ncbi:uncharacterized protein LOC130777197 [Actinidia eriantha]|uniref:uncharacterized protein LOC130777197 n=1 Tax=Actinidia eriantha TaxID=165200 RepID=UPI0025847511|nr:uncharacterized protein LOC130777197 [Actinidia eriantha]
MDDYPIVLGMEFLDGVRAFPILFAETMCIMGEGSACMVPLVREALLKSKTLSAMQLSKEENEPTFLATLKEVDHSIGLETSAQIPATILTKSLGAFKLAKRWHADMSKAAKRMKKWAGKNLRLNHMRVKHLNSKPKDSKESPWGRDSSCRGSRATSNPRESPYGNSWTRSPNFESLLSVFCRQKRLNATRVEGSMIKLVTTGTDKAQPSEENPKNAVFDVAVSRILLPRGFRELCDNLHALGFSCDILRFTRELSMKLLALVFEFVCKFKLLKLEFRNNFFLKWVLILRSWDFFILFEICENGFERPSKITKHTNQNEALLEEASRKASLSSHVSLEGSPPQQLNGNPENNSDAKDKVVSNGDLGLIPSNDSKNNEPKVGQKRSNAVTRTPSETQDRVIAERKRREKLSQRFIALSAIIPGLKKVNKASVLGDAIKYLKHLQEHVKLLEEQINKKSKESVVFVKSSQLSGGDDTSSCNENFDSRMKEVLPEIEARISEKNVLIRVHSEKQKGFAAKLLSEIEKNHLSVVNSSFLPFGQYAMDITVVAQVFSSAQLFFLYIA